MLTSRLNLEKHTTTVYHWVDVTKTQVEEMDSNQREMWGQRGVWQQPKHQLTTVGRGPECCVWKWDFCIMWTEFMILIREGFLSFTSVHSKKCRSMNWTDSQWRRVFSYSWLFCFASNGSIPESRIVTVNQSGPGGCIYLSHDGNGGPLVPPEGHSPLFAAWSLSVLFWIWRFPETVFTSADILCFPLCICASLFRVRVPEQTRFIVQRATEWKPLICQWEKGAVPF